MSRKYYRAEQAKNADNAILDLSDTLGRTLEEMRAKASEAGVPPEDMVLTPEGIKVRPGAKGAD